MEFSKISELTIKGKSVRSLAKGGKEFWGKHHLPLAYQEVQYLESSGTQLIDTELVFPDVDSFFVKASLKTLSDNQYIVGVRDNATKAVGFGVYFSAHGGLTYYPLLWRSDTIDQSVSAGEIFTLHTKLSTSGGFFKVNDTLRDSYNTALIQADKSIYLFALHGSSPEYPMKGRIYRAEAFLGDTLVRSFIPCYRKSDNEAGLFDTVTRRFFTNAGTGAFTVGPAV